jgi:thiamine kinase-like enzyme/CTP:molybdopterin cytidylyltransferase MocA
MVMKTHIIVQAGGRGSRLRHHTWNKPKCLVSVRGKPLLYHLFDRFPDAHFHIIGDYAFEQLEKYLQTNTPQAEYTLTKTTAKGTASGIIDTLKTVPHDSELYITWSDLIIGDLPDIPETNLPVIFTTEAFTCRWTLSNDRLVEQPGPTGIPGIFYVKCAKDFPEPPASGEFVKWFSKNVLDFKTVNCNDLEEIGDFSTIEFKNDRAGFSRFFNEVKILDATVEKRAIDSNYAHLIQKEQLWYKSVGDLGFRRIPKIISSEPYIMQRIHGSHAYQMNDLTEREKRSVLSDYLESLTQLHDLGTQPSVDDEVKETYILKTINRVESVSNIIPGFEQKSMTINGVKCKNIFSDQNVFDQIFKKLNPRYFTPIHGDPTFSNSLVDKNLKVWYIDPRGYFAKPGIWGDPMYDFAKVYYSTVGSYDSFNRRKFKLHVDNETTEIIMQESPFEVAGKEIFNEYFGKNIGKIEVLHGLIWLALSGYAKDDIDSVIGSFYLGLYYLEQGLKKL